MNWVELFQEEARGIQPAPKRVTSMLKSYRYAMSNFGAAMAAMTLKRYAELRRQGMGHEDAQEYVYCRLMDDAILEANEDKVREFFAELPPSWQDELEVLWLGALQGAASNHERERDQGLE